VHALKSASANVGAMKLSESAREQERAVDRGDETFVDRHVMQLLSEYEEQIECIREFLSGCRGEEGGKRDSRAIDKSELAREIGEALERLENFRAKQCAGKLEEILQYRLTDGIESKIIGIKEQLRLYEDDVAEQMLRELIAQIEKEDL
jgi:Hpt domain.